MSIKTPYRVRPGLFAVGFFFLLNADVNIVDFLPDIFGWGIICFALYGLHDLSYKLEQAIKYSAYLALASLARGLMLVSGDVYFSPSNTLLLTFVFSLINLILSFLFTSAFFEGLSHVATRGDSKRVPAECSGAMSFTYLFFAAKSVLVVLPELVALSQTDELMDTSSAVGYYNLLELKPYFVIIQFALVTLLGLAWFIIIRQLFKVMSEDKELLRYIEDRYITSILSDTRLQLRRSLRSGLLLCSLGCAAYITIAMDRMNILPEFLPAALLLWGGHILAKRHAPFSRIRIPAIALAVCSVLTFITELVIKETTLDYNFLKAMKDVPLDMIALVLSVGVAVTAAWCALTLYRTAGTLTVQYCLPAAREEWIRGSTTEWLLFLALCACTAAAKIILPNFPLYSSAVVVLLISSGIGLTILLVRRLLMARDTVMKGTF